ncbi:MAG: HlyD family secretion protein [Oscillospiraceae bacterium]|jgi:hypothetical protein|nr:HlyD family secretion protein [Oscillospiraceae bacterium]
MKKVAIRAGVILAVVLACSMFFAQTILTVTTPKIKYVQVAYRRFEEKVEFTSALYFARTDKIALPDAAKTPITVDRLYVRVGDLVNAGDTICTTRLSDDFQKSVDDASDALVKAREEYMQNEVANIKLVDHTDTDKNETFREVNDAGAALAQAQSEILGAAAKLGLVLPQDAAQWAALVQQQNDENLTALMETTLVAQTRVTAANQAFLDTYATSKTKKELYDFLNRRAELQRTVDRAQNTLVQLVATSQAMTTVRAEHAGYVLALALAEGETYAGGGPAYELSATEDPPVLRVDVSGRQRVFATGMRAEIQGEFGPLRTEVARVVREGVDKKYLHIALSSELISQLGGVRAMLEKGATVGVTYRAQDNTSVLPAAAVRTDGSDTTAFVYVAEETDGGLWGGSTVARKTPVTITDRGDKEVAVREDLRYSRVVYQEDRALTDGGRVMEYVD